MSKHLPLGKPMTLDKLLAMDRSDAPSIEEIQARYLHEVEGVEAELGPLAGVQLWVRGDAAVEVDVWPDADGRWRPHVNLGGP